jgi:uncharacterized protein (TIGR00369 family)
MSPPSPEQSVRALLAQAQLRTRAEPALSLAAIPALASLSAEVLAADAQTLQLGFTVPAEATHGDGVVGGGALATMLDLSMALAVLMRLDASLTCSTISLMVNMLAAGLQGRFVAEAKIDRLGRQVAFAQASLFDEARTRLIAQASASLAVRPVQALNQQIQARSAPPPLGVMPCQH